VGEVVPGSASAKEISDLWLYIQERLSRIVRDPKLLPDVKPAHLAISSLLATGMEPPELIEAPPLISVPGYEGPDRRGGADRRVLIQPHGAERRAFGRRASDQPQWGWK
jgi:hypothetical protein